MSKEMTTTPKDQALIAAIEQAVTTGNIDGLNSEQRMFYYNRVCESVGLNPLTRPLDFIKLNGRTVLYARKDATDQLRKIHGVSISRVDQVVQEGCCVVTAYAKDRHGKEDSDMGAVPVANLKGEAYANAIMKCVTKAKRRVTLSICGMGLLDESEFDTVPEAMAQIKIADVQSKTEAKTDAMKARLLDVAKLPQAAPAANSEPTEAELLPAEKKPSKRPPATWDEIKDDMTPQKKRPPVEDPYAFFEKPTTPPPELKTKEQKLPKAAHLAAIERLRRAKDMKEAKEAWDAGQAAIKSREIDLEKMPPREAAEFVQNFKSARDEKKRELTTESKL